MAPRAMAPQPARHNLRASACGLWVPCTSSAWGRCPEAAQAADAVRLHRGGDDEDLDRAGVHHGGAHGRGSASTRVVSMVPPEATLSQWSSRTTGNSVACWARANESDRLSDPKTNCWRAAQAWARQASLRWVAAATPLVVQTTTLRPALATSALGKPTNIEAARAWCWSSAAMQLACRSLLGALCVPCLSTWAAWGRCPRPWRA